MTSYITDEQRSNLIKLRDGAMDRLGVLFDPRFWLRTYPVSHEWSDKLDCILDRLVAGEIGIKKSGLFAVSIGGDEVRVGGWPYAFGMNQSAVVDVVPKRKTAIRLREILLFYDAEVSA